MRTPPILFDGIDALEDVVNGDSYTADWDVVEEFFQCASIEIEAEHDLLFGAGFDIDVP